MNKDLIVSASENEIQIALLEDKQLVELHKDKLGNKIHVGDIFVGKVRKIMPGLNAAFIDVGEDKDGFVHYLDLGPNYGSVSKYMRLAMNGDASVKKLDNFKVEPVLEKTGNISNVLKVGQLVLGQVAKEPISTKGPKLTGDLSFAGRYLVLTPFITRISISQKIKGAEERGRLRRLIQSIKPANFGVIVRTIAEGKDVAELDADLRQLMAQWEMLAEKLKHITGPQKIISENPLGKFTLVGATTRSGQLSAPLRDRFGVILKLELYSPDELKHIIMRSANLLGIGIEELGASEIAKRSRGTPRIANRLLKRVRDFAEVRSNGVITQALADEALTQLEIDELGLDSVDRRLLESIIKNYGGGPVGLETLASTINEEAVTIEDMYEPFLLQQGFITRTPRGRCATKRAYEHLGLAYLGQESFEL